MFSINEWRDRYEVSMKGREPKGDEELRAGPLSFVRLKVYGHRQGTGYRRLQQACGKRFMEVFGIFCKLLEISGDQIRDRRGSLYNEKDEPATTGDLAFMIGIPFEQVEHAVSKLSDVGWLSDDKTPSLNTTQHNTTQLKAPGISGENRKPPAKSLKVKHLDSVFLTKIEHDKLVERFGEKPTAVWILKLDSYIGSKGREYKSHYKTIISWSLHDDRTKNPTSNGKSRATEQDYGDQESKYGQTIEV